MGARLSGVQDRQPDGKTIFDFEFELTETELKDFKKEIKSSLNMLLPIRLTIGPAGSRKFRFERRALAESSDGKAGRNCPIRGQPPTVNMRL